MLHHGYKRDKFKDVVNLVLNEENITENLKNDIYINENKTIYISEEDVRNLFDNSIYYDEKYNQIITTSDTKVANIVIDEKQMIINSSNVSMLDSIIRIDDKIYLPISDMNIVYNISIEYIDDSKKVVIDNLDKGMIKAMATEDTDIKFRPRRLSKNIGTLKQGEIVNCFYTTSKGWRQIRTSDGTIGYIKANKLGNEYIVRQDMQTKGEAIKIQKSDYDRKNFEISDNISTKNISLKDAFSVNKNNEEILELSNNDNSTDKIWAIITNESIDSQTLQDYKTRTDLIDLIVKRAIKSGVNGISVDFTGIEDKDSIKRFIIEMSPKLREVGISTCIVLNENIEEQDYINVVDYIVE